MEMPPTRVSGHGRLVMKTRTSVWVTLIAAGLLILPVAASSHAQDDSGSPSAYSHVRIVRLSFVEGTVTVQKPDVQDWSVAPMNTPIEEGFKLSTSEQSFSEVEFENTSTARLGQLTLLDFNQLVMTPSGNKLNRMTLEQGYATFTVEPEGMEAFEVKAQDATITLAAGATTQFRVDLDGGAVRVEVFKGAANVSSPQGQQTLTRNTMVEIRPGAEQAFNITQGIVKDAWDQWVNERDNQEAVVRNSPTPGIYSADNNNSYYGWNDLSNYGAWNYFPGYGYGWGPNMGIGWSPFMDGRWCWYPGFGYTWISAEPWGWLPYHYGGWSFVAGFGWTWFPGSFSSWTPGNVNWSQGSGWVGWTPRPPHGRLGVGNCIQSQTCGRVIVSQDTLRNGKPVTRATILSSEVAGGRDVSRPDIIPGREGMLPGTPFSSRGGISAKPGAGSRPQVNEGGQVASGRNIIVVGESTEERRTGPRPVANDSGTRNGAPSERGVAFDPATGRFVNSNGPGGQSPNARVNTGDPSVTSNESGPVLAPNARTINTPGPTRESPWAARETGGSAPGPSHREAPSVRPTPAPSSGSSHSWWNSNSNSSSSGGSGSSSRGSGYGGGRSSPWGSGGGSQSSGSNSSYHNSGSSSGGGGSSYHSTGGGGGASSGGSTGGGSRGGGGPHK
jgi:hypothetical protein